MNFYQPAEQAQASQRLKAQSQHAAKKLKRKPILSVRLMLSGAALLLGLIFTLCSQESLLGYDQPTALTPVVMLAHYHLRLQSSPSWSEVNELMTTANALKAMLLFWSTGLVAGVLLAYRRALRSLWRHMSMTLLEQLISAPRCRRYLMCASIITALMGGILHSYLLLSCPCFFLNGFMSGYGVTYRLVASSRH